MIDQLQKRDLGEFQSTLERHLGMSTYITKSDAEGAVLHLVTETGVVLGEIKVTLDKGFARFGGCSSLLPNDWEKLCQL